MKKRYQLCLILCVICLSSFKTFAFNTMAQLYRPFAGSDKHPKPIVHEHKKGHCFAQSYKIKREDAWRCIADGNSYDPCFKKAFQTKNSVICPLSPWTSESVMIEVDKMVDSAPRKALDMSRTYPWAIELTNGDKCMALDTIRFQNDLPVRYQCQKGGPLIGHLQRCKPVWTILQLTESKTKLVEISRAWF